MDPPWCRCHRCPPRCLSWLASLQLGSRRTRRLFLLRNPRPAHPQSRRLQRSLPLPLLPLALFRLLHQLHQLRQLRQLRQRQQRQQRRRLDLTPPPCLRPPQPRRLILRGRKHRRLPHLPPRRHRLRNLLSPQKRLKLLHLPGPRHRPRLHRRCCPGPPRRRHLTARLPRRLHPSSPRSSTSRCWSPWRTPRRVAQQSGRPNRLRSSRSPT